MQDPKFSNAMTTSVLRRSGKPAQIALSLWGIQPNRMAAPTRVT